VALVGLNVAFGLDAGLSSARAGFARARLLPGLPTDRLNRGLTRISEGTVRAAADRLVAGYHRRLLDSCRGSSRHGQAVTRLSAVSHESNSVVDWKASGHHLARLALQHPRPSSSISKALAVHLPQTRNPGTGPGSMLRIRAHGHGASYQR
jgi:hypothetical protein